MRLKSKCLACRCGLDYNPKQNAGKYCSIRCQQDHAWKERKALIKKTGCFASNRQAKRWLLELHGHVCSICKRKKWCGEPIPLVLDHIDGKHDNLRVTNYRLICPNCDAQTPTYKNKNKGNGRQDRMQRYEEGKTY